MMDRARVVSFVALRKKPDMIDAGSETDVLAIMQNHRKPLRLGCAESQPRNHTHSALTLIETTS